MTRRTFSGGIVKATQFTTSTGQTTASGVWNINDVAQRVGDDEYPGLPGVPTSVSYLVVAGGGGGGQRYSGGGGAGGMLTGTYTPATGKTYTVTVGAGGNIDQNGNDSSLVNTTDSSNISVATAGGAGGTYADAGGSVGGSGGGGGATVGGSAMQGGDGVSGQGNAGGNSIASSYTNCAGGGGKGAAGANGGQPSTNNGGAGGVGGQSSISGSAVYYAGGGGGRGSTGGSGGQGGGGDGRNYNTGGSAGSANTGGGGGGGGSSANTGYAGGSGVVIISMPSEDIQPSTTGSPSVTTSGTNTIYTFTGSGTFSWAS